MLLLNVSFALVSSTSYSTAIDMWALGCVFVEMCVGSLLFSGDSHIGQVEHVASYIVGMLGEEGGRG